MTSRERLLRKIAELQAEIEAMPERPAEPKVNGAVIRFKMDFGRPGSGVYTYVAIRSNGRWFVSGRNAPQGVKWSELWEWIEDRHGPAKDTKVEQPVGWLDL